jgi:hypothetical protein
VPSQSEWEAFSNAHAAEWGVPFSFTIWCCITRLWHETRWLSPKTNNFIMAKPTQPVTLSMEQIGELNQKLSTLRHDLNNSLSLIAATVTLIRRRPTVTEQTWNALAEQPRKIGESISQFSRDLEATLRIARD